MSQTNDPSKPAKESPPSEESKSRSGLGWLVVLLLVAACILVGLAMARRSAKQAASAPEPAAAPVTNAAPVASQTDAAAVSNSVPTPPAPPEFKLQGIVFDSTRPWAIVNGRTVYTDSQLGNFRVTAITKDTVTLEDTNGVEKVLRVGK